MLGWQCGGLHPALWNVENNQIQLQGQARNAAGLISVLTASPFLANPKLEGQIQPDPRTGKDRFTIVAEPKDVPVDQIVAHAPVKPATPPADDVKSIEIPKRDDKEAADGTP